MGWCSWRRERMLALQCLVWLASTWSLGGFYQAWQACKFLILAWVTKNQPQGRRPTEDLSRQKQSTDGSTQEGSTQSKASSGGEDNPSQARSSTCYRQNRRGRLGILRRLGAKKKPQKQPPDKRKRAECERIMLQQEEWVR